MLRSRARSLAIRSSPQNGGMVLLGITDTDVAALGGFGTLILACVAVAQIRRAAGRQGLWRIRSQPSRTWPRRSLPPCARTSRPRSSRAASCGRRRGRKTSRSVFAYPSGTVKGPDTIFEVGPGEVGFRYRLINEGTGVALNIRHGVELCGILREHGDGMEVLNAPRRAVA